jgi:hypothetical protein
VWDAQRGSWVVIGDPNIHPQTHYYGAPALATNTVVGPFPGSGAFPYSRMY